MIRRRYAVDPEDPPDDPHPSEEYDVDVLRLEPWNRPMEPLFTIRLDFDHESFMIPYESVDAALRDPGLAWIMDHAIASVWSGNLRVTRDITDWDILRAQLVANASVLLRSAL